MARIETGRMAAMLFLPLLLVFSGCTDTTGRAIFDASGGDGVSDAADIFAEVARDALDVPDVPDVPVDAVVPDVPAEVTDVVEEPCSDGELRCLVDTAERCEDGVWVDIGECPLGCDETSAECYVPSNLPADLMDPTAGDVDLTGTSRDITMDTDTGEIRDASGGSIRGPVLGYDSVTGTSFAVIDQGEGLPGIGVFVVGDFTVPGGATLHAEGTNALAILASGSIVVNGIISICASGQDPGPGGWRGGNDGEAGTGPCPRSPGEGTASTEHHCTSGGGGGGFGGTGGSGGDAITECTYAGGSGGGPCGRPQITPLIGGSGGGGGGIAVGDTSSFPGTGGGGGGALQLVAAIQVSLGDGGGVHAAGDGGGESNIAGGGGGGAGGAVLIEAPDVDVNGGAVIAANAGGGGAGDCT
ncbi:MAG: hypothetical protein JRG91_20170 [Deltaproteobacteria bacterium]|nr:hypothetical protein [Deltaproteobacteria bacterium]